MDFMSGWTYRTERGAHALSGLIVAACMVAAILCPAARGEAFAQDNPRATVQTFLAHMDAVAAGAAERMDAAIDCLYLGEGDERLSGEQAAERAAQLYAVINRFTLHLEGVPEEVEGRTCEVVLKQDVGDEDGVTLSLRRYDDGLWRFQSKTLAALTAIHAELLAAPQESAELKIKNPKLRSARAAMRTFIEGMNRWDEGGKEDALSALDLSEIKAQVRDWEGPELADRLKQVLDRDKLVVYSEIPDDPEGEPYVHITYPEGDVVIAPVESEGGVEWKFTAQTLGTLRDLYEEYKGRAVAEGVADDGPKSTSLRLRNAVGERFPFLLREAFLLENWQWLGLFAVILAGMIVSRLVTLALAQVIRRRFQHAQMSLDQKIERDFIRPIRIALMAWVWYLGLWTLGLRPETLVWLRGAAQTVTAVGAVWALYRLIDVLGGYLFQKAQRSENKFDDILAPLVVRSLKIFVVVVGVVFVADSLGYEPTTVLAGLGLGGLAFALAAKDTVANIFGSLTILIDRPFQIGDWVIIGDAEGSVESVGIRSTRIRTFYNSLVAVPNAELLNATIDNMGARRYRRIKMMIAVTYDTPPEKIEAFCEGIRHLICIHPYTRKDYYHVWFNAFADSALNILLYCFLETPDWGTELRERHRLLLDITRLAHRLGVEFAFPTQTLYMRQETQPPPGPAKPGAPTADDAFVLGRREAAAIVEQQLGKDAPPPPPVTYGAPGDADITMDDVEADNGDD